MDKEEQFFSVYSFLIIFALTVVFINVNLSLLFSIFQCRLLFLLLRLFVLYIIFSINVCRLTMFSFILHFFLASGHLYLNFNDNWLFCFKTWSMTFNKCGRNKSENIIDFILQRRFYFKEMCSNVQGKGVCVYRMYMCWVVALEKHKGWKVVNVRLWLWSVFVIFVAIHTRFCFDWWV